MNDNRTVRVQSWMFLRMNVVESLRLSEEQTVINTFWELITVTQTPVLWWDTTSHIQENTRDQTQSPHLTAGKHWRKLGVVLCCVCACLQVTILFIHKNHSDEIAQVLIYKQQFWCCVELSSLRGRDADRQCHNVCVYMWSNEEKLNLHNKRNNNN